MSQGLSWTAITKTMLAPNGGMSNKLLGSKEFKYARAEMHTKAPTAEIKLFFMVSPLR